MEQGEKEKTYWPQEVKKEVPTTLNPRPSLPETRQTSVSYDTNVPVTPLPESILGLTWMLPLRRRKVGVVTGRNHVFSHEVLSFRCTLI